MSVGSAKQTQGFADVFGGRSFNTIDYSGPTSYNNTGSAATSGDTMDPHMFGFQNTIQALFAEGTDQTGAYKVTPQPINNGITAWRLRWFTTAGTEVSNAVNLSTITVKLSAIGF